jgi:hypothetical protein
MKLVFIRESDAETFEMSAYASGAFVLDSGAQIPGSTTLDVTGYEYSGRDGGYNTSSRKQRRAITIPFSIREDYTTTQGLFELIRQASGFFIEHEADLTSLYYTVEFYTNDRTQSSFMLRHGIISVPFNADTQVGEHNAKAQLGLIFGDPYFYPIGESGLNFDLYAGGQTTDQGGRRWDTTDGAIWDATDGKVWENAGGSGDPITVDVVSVTSVPVSIVSNGILVSPQVVNLTNGSSFTYNGTLDTLDVLTVDTNGTVLVNGTTPAFTYSGNLTASNGANTFALIAAAGSPGYVTLTILGAF